MIPLIKTLGFEHVAKPPMLSDRVDDGTRLERAHFQVEPQRQAGCRHELVGQPSIFPGKDVGARLRVGKYGRLPDCDSTLPNTLGCFHAV